MTAERVKIFLGNEVNEIEPQINQWLASLSPNTEVRRSESAATIQYSQNTTSLMIVVSIWYIGGSN